MPGPENQSVLLLRLEISCPCPPATLVDDAVLGAQIKTTFNAENGCYGAKRVTAAINSDPVNDRGKGGRLNHKRTARLMR